MNTTSEETRFIKSRFVVEENPECKVPAKKTTRKKSHDNYVKIGTKGRFEIFVDKTNPAFRELVKNYVEIRGRFKVQYCVSENYRKPIWEIDFEGDHVSSVEGCS